MASENAYGFVGINARGLPYATDGLSEAGLTVGALFFPGFGEFQQPRAAQVSVTISSVDLGKLDFNAKHPSAFPLDQERVQDIKDRSADFPR